jgi:hypothetical protein
MPEWLKAKFSGLVTFGFGLVCWPIVLSFLIGTVNRAGHLGGFGEKVTVTVQTSNQRNIGRGYSPGTGYYERDGERVGVRIWDGQPGEKVSTTLPLIPWAISGVRINTTALYVKGSRALGDLIWNLIGTLFFVVMAVVCTFSGIALLWIRME